MRRATGEERTGSGSGSGSKRPSIVDLLGIACFLALLGLQGEARAGEVESRHTNNGATYSVRVPDGWDKKKGGLLVVGLSGKEGSREAFARALAAVAEVGSAVVAVPDPPEGGWTSSDDIPATAVFLADVQKEYRPLRTVLVGFDDGADFATCMGIRHAERVDAVLACSGGIGAYPVPNPAPFALRRVAFYETWGTADLRAAADVKKTVKTLESAGVWRLRADPVRDLGHEFSTAAFARGIAWVENVLPAPCRPLADEEAEERWKALAQALKAKDEEQVEKAFLALAGSPVKMAAKIGGQAKLSVLSTSPKIVLAAIEAASHCGEWGVSPLEACPREGEALAGPLARALIRTGPAAQGTLLSLLRAKSTAVALAAARSLGDLGNRASLETLVRGLQAAEDGKVEDERVAAVNAALAALTGESFTKASEWRQWLAEAKEDKKLGGK